MQIENYSYVALNKEGKKVRGKVSAANEADLEKKISIIGLDLISSSISKNKGSSFFHQVKIEDLVVLCVHLEQLDRAGVPILDSIADLRDSAESEYAKDVMTNIYEEVRSGSVLSAAFAKYPKIFDSVFVALVAAGEKTGNLYEIFSHLAKHLRWISNIQRKIKKATYYPIFLLFLMVGILSLMMLFVIPKLSSFLTAQNFELPFYTKALISTSNFFVNYWYVALLIPVLIVSLLKILPKFYPQMQYNIDKFKLNIPYIGNTIRKIELARFCRFFGIMYRSGIDILDCLSVANEAVKNKVISKDILAAKKEVSNGMSLTLSLKNSAQFPSLVLRMFKVGEDSGNLDATLENVNFFYDREVEDSVNNMIGIIQPALTIVMGALMLWISMAVFGPLYNSFSHMNF